MAALNYILVVLLLVCPLIQAWTVHFEPENVTTIYVDDTVTVNVTLNGLDGVHLIKDEEATISIVSDSDILKVSKQIDLDEITDGSWTGEFNITGVFLGKSRIFAEIVSKHGDMELSNQTLTVVILRKEKRIDRIFNLSVAALVTILYINFGAALDLGKVKEILVRPIGPLIAFGCKFLFMPLVSESIRSQIICQCNIHLKFTVELLLGHPIVPKQR